MTPIDPCSPWLVARQLHAAKVSTWAIGTPTEARATRQRDALPTATTRNEDFRILWPAHNVRLHHTGVKNFHHPVVSDLSLPFEAMPLPADPGLPLTAFSARHSGPGRAQPPRQLGGDTRPARPDRRGWDRSARPSAREVDLLAAHAVVVPSEFRGHVGARRSTAGRQTSHVTGLLVSGVAPRSDRRCPWCR